jgi:hypothetical protein
MDKMAFDLSLVKKLPTEMELEIVSYMIPDSKKIEFVDYVKNHCIESSYSFRYKTAFYKNMNDKVRNRKGQFLSRIPKKNGKHRYYITEEKKIRLDDETEYDEYGAIYYYSYQYKSKYVGKNINKALLTLFTG